MVKPTSAILASAPIFLPRNHASVSVPRWLGLFICRMTSRRSRLWHLAVDDLLRPAPPCELEGDYKEKLETTARLLESVLEDSGVTASVIAVRPRPAVVTYEVELARGVRASRVDDLADDIARSMSMPRPV